MDAVAIRAEVEAARVEIAMAADDILRAVDLGLAQARAARQGDPAALAALDGALCAVLQACAFQDLTGQRLAKALRLLDGGAADEGGLLNGPQLHGAGLDQAAADALFADL